MISVVIPTYNRSCLLHDALASFFEQEGLDEETYELTVVDNRSTDDTRQVVESFDARYLFEEKQGVSHARNRAMMEARGDLIAYLDDDVIFSWRWLKELREGAERWPDAAGFGGRAVARWDFPKPRWFVDDGPYTMRGMISHFEPDLPEGPMDLCPFGCNMAFRASALRDAGGFSTGLGRRGDGTICGEETVLFQKLLHDGGAVVYLPGASVFHRVHGNRRNKKYYANLTRIYQASVRLWDPEQYAQPGEPLRKTLRRNRWVARALAARLAEWAWLGMTFRWSSMFSRWLSIIGLREHLRLELRSRSQP